MTVECTKQNEDKEIDLAALQTIAANVVEWGRRQADAAEEWPLAYIDCLLREMRAMGNIAWGDIPDVLCRYAPWLTPKVSLELVSAYLDSRPNGD